MTARWSVVIPVKSPAHGKSRLGGDEATRTALARAIALDTMAAAAACTEVEQVVVVTGDADLAADATGIDRVRVVAEDVPRGLHTAISTGMAEVSGYRAAMLGDLPALRPDHLAAVLRRARAVPRGVVADTEGTGSTLVTANPDTPWACAFGPDSFARHRALGCIPLDAPACVRRDVDSPAQVEAAATLGLGSRTRLLRTAAGSPR